VLHEVGHGLYEQGLPRELSGTPLGQAASLGIHESQSRLWENQIGRSRAFWTFWLPVVRTFFPGPLRDAGLDSFLQTLHVAKPGFIRVEADETTYNLHIVLRFEMETALLSGDLTVDDLPSAWNSRFEKLLGLKVPDNRHGYLQDVHWSGGGLGYFPTYTLGNLYAAQFMAAARRALPDLEIDLSRGCSAKLLGWLRNNIHSKGRAFRPEDLCRQATGEAPSTKYLLAHLETLAP
jgi:carboxypeptidase Taq